MNESAAPVSDEEVAKVILKLAVLIHAHELPYEDLVIVISLTAKLILEIGISRGLMEVRAAVEARDAVLKAASPSGV